MTEELTIPEYFAGTKDLEKQFQYALKLEKEAEEYRRKAEECENVLKAFYECLKGNKSEVFAVADLKPLRVPDLEYIRVNLPKVYWEYLTISATDIGRIMQQHYTRSDLQVYLRGIEPELFEEKAKILMTDLDAALGGKKESRKYEGTAYHVEWKASPKTHIVIKNTELYEKLTGEVLRDDDD